MLTTKPIAIGARVIVTSSARITAREQRGRVAGYATVEDQPTMLLVNTQRGPRFVVLVTLDEGFYNAAGDIFTQTIVCDPSTVSVEQLEGEPHIAVYGFSSVGPEDRVNIVFAPLHRQGCERLELDAISAREWGNAITRRAESIIEEQRKEKL